MADTLPSRQFLVQQAVLNAAFAEMRSRLPSNGPEMTRHWLRGRFGDAPFGGSQAGLSNIVSVIRDEYRALVAQYSVAA